MVQAAEIAETDNVLVVGCATGYAAAVLAQLGCRVTATESDPALAAKAQEILAGLGLSNVTVRTAAAAEGDATDAPFDVIVLNGATEITPERLYRQLKEGGRLVGVFATTQPPRATIITHSHDDFGNRALFDAVVPVLPGLEWVPAFVF
jgi:protein-L-isoaspartate(D-aspartate) O-methyltransferase